MQCLVAQCTVLITTIITTAKLPFALVSLFFFLLPSLSLSPSVMKNQLYSIDMAFLLFSMIALCLLYPP